MFLILVDFADGLGALCRWVTASFGVARNFLHWRWMRAQTVQLEGFFGVSSGARSGALRVSSWRQLYTPDNVLAHALTHRSTRDR
jgi:hypothetical protein